MKSKSSKKLIHIYSKSHTDESKSYDCDDTEPTFQLLSTLLSTYTQFILKYPKLINFINEITKLINGLKLSIGNYGLLIKDKDTILTDFFSKMDNIHHTIYHFYDNNMITQSLNFFNKQILKVGNSMKIAEQSLEYKSQEVNNYFYNFYSELISIQKLIKGVYKTFEITNLIEPFNQLYNNADATFSDIFESSKTKRYKYCLMCIKRVQENLEEYQNWIQNQDEIKETFLNLQKQANSITSNDNIRNEEFNQIEEDVNKEKQEKIQSENNQNEE